MIKLWTIHIYAYTVRPFLINMRWFWLCLGGCGEDNCMAFRKRSAASTCNKYCGMYGWKRVGWNGVRATSSSYRTADDGLLRRRILFFTSRRLRRRGKEEGLRKKEEKEGSTKGAHCLRRRAWSTNALQVNVSPIWWPDSMAYIRVCNDRCYYYRTTREMLVEDTATVTIIMWPKHIRGV